MNGANAATEPASVASDEKIDVETLEDILYEILAAGMGTSDKDLDLTHVEKFLHEHARSAKSNQEFIDFFKEHSISTDPNVHMKSAQLRPLPTPLKIMPPAPMEKPAAPAPNPAAPIPQSSPMSQPKVEQGTLEIEPEPLVDLLAQTSDEKQRTGWLLGFSVAIAFALLFGLLGGFGYLWYQDIQTEIKQTQSLHRETLQAIVALQDELKNVQADVAFTHQTNQKLEQKIGYLPETIVQELNRLRKGRKNR